MAPLPGFGFNSQPPPPPSGSGNHWNGGAPSQDWNRRPPFNPHASSAGATNGGAGPGGGGPRPQSPPVDPNPNLYIHNVPKDASEGELRDLFSTFGKVDRIRLKVNQKIGPQALYAFVTFQTTAEAQAALERLNGFDMRTRKLRIEFQRSRGDDDRPHHDDYESNYNRERSLPRGDFRGEFRGGSDFRGGGNDFRGGGNDFRGGGNDFRGGNGDRRNKRGGYDDKPSFVESEGPSFKRARYFESSERADHHHRRNNNPQRPPLEFPTEQDNRWRTTQPPPQQQTQQQARITILLCDILRRAKPHLFSQPPKGYSAPALQTAPVDESPKSQMKPRQQFQPVQQPSAPASLVTPAPSLTPGSTARVGTTWLGSLARNNKKKVPVEIYSIEGAIEPFLGSDTTYLNIAHRSAFEDVIKKPLGATCFIRLASQDISETGEPMPLTTQKMDIYRKAFADHLEYLTLKGRAGVVTLSDKKQLYIIPPGAPFFDSLRKNAVPSEPEVLLGLFTMAPTTTGSPSAAPVLESSAPPPMTSLPSDQYQHLQKQQEQPQHQLQQPPQPQGFQQQSQQQNFQQQPQQQNFQQQPQQQTFQQQPQQQNFQQQPPQQQSFQQQQNFKQQSFQQQPQQQQSFQQQPHQHFQQQPPPQQQQTFQQQAYPMQHGGVAQQHMQQQHGGAPAQMPSSLMNLLSNPKLLASLKNAAQRPQ